MREHKVVTLAPAAAQAVKQGDGPAVALTSSELSRIWLAEFIGTFALVLIGVGAVTVGISGLGVAIAFGSIVAVMIAAVGPISSAHFNPAVTIGFVVLNRVGVRKVALYWSAQFLGATVAMFFLQTVLSRETLATVAFGATQLRPRLSLMSGLATEIVLTFFLMFVIASIVIRTHALDGIYIGTTVALCALVGGPLTGASMNPARSLAPAFFGSIWANHWIYWVGPFVGAALGAAIARHLWQER